MTKLADEGLGHCGLQPEASSAAQQERHRGAPFIPVPNAAITPTRTRCVEACPPP